jgi:hypothetical protein
MSYSIESPETEKFTLAEMTHGELKAPSAEVDPESGDILSVRELIESVALAKGYRIWTTPNGELSKEAQDHNTAVTRSPDLSDRERDDLYKVAVRIERPVGS